jgi:IclR family KDG regulon transcriptional repressor
MRKAPASGVGKNSVVKSVGRAFEVLEAFNEVRRPMLAIEIATRFSFPVSSTAALLKSMVKLGYLSFDQRDRRYFPTIRIAIISEYLHGALFGQGSLMALMGDLHSLIGETIILGIRKDLEAQHVHIIPGIYPIMLNVPPGTVRPLHRSGMGWALLSQCEDAEIRAIVDRINADGRGSPIDHKELVATLKEVRALGYARSYGTYVAGSGIIAMNLPATSNDRRVAIGAGGPVDRLQSREREIVRLMRAAINRHFGKP